MGGSGIIDQFLNVFTAYIDSGFGLLGGAVGFLSQTLIALDITLAGLFWALAGEEDVIARLIKKTLYIGFFAFLIGNFNWLAKIVFESFSGLGLKAAALARASSVSSPKVLVPISQRSRMLSPSFWRHFRFSASAFSVRASQRGLFRARRSLAPERRRERGSRWSTLARRAQSPRGRRVPALLGATKNGGRHSLLSLRHDAGRTGQRRGRLQASSPAC